MYKKLSITDGNLLAIRAEDKVVSENYDYLNRQIDDVLSKHQEINLYLEFGNVTDITQNAMWDDFKLGIKYFTKFRRIVVVGDKVWERWVAEISNLLTTAEVKFFPFERKAEALIWLKM